MSPRGLWVKGTWEHSVLLLQLPMNLELLQNLKGSFFKKVFNSA